MSDADDIAISLARALHQEHAELEKHVQAHVERVVGRAVIKIGLVGFCSALLVGATAVWKTKAWVDDIDIALRGQQGQLSALDTKANTGIEAHKLAFAAKAEADSTAAKLEGHMRPDTQAKR